MFLFILWGFTAIDLRKLRNEIRDIKDFEF